jgi:hypothetical protein
VPVRCCCIGCGRSASAGVKWPRGRGSSGTFRETWALRWEPELTIRVIELSAHGTTVASAAAHRLLEQAPARRLWPTWCTSSTPRCWPTCPTSCSRWWPGGGAGGARPRCRAGDRHARAAGPCAALRRRARHRRLGAAPCVRRARRASARRHRGGLPFARRRCSGRDGGAVGRRAGGARAHRPCGAPRRVAGGAHPGGRALRRARPGAGPRHAAAARRRRVEPRAGRATGVACAVGGHGPAVGAAFVEGLRCRQRHGAGARPRVARRHRHVGVVVGARCVRGHGAVAAPHVRRVRAGERRQLGMLLAHHEMAPPRVRRRRRRRARRSSAGHRAAVAGGAASDRAGQRRRAFPTLANGAGRRRGRRRRRPGRHRCAAGRARRPHRRSARCGVRRAAGRRAGGSRSGWSGFVGAGRGALAGRHPSLLPDAAWCR